MWVKHRNKAGRAAGVGKIVSMGFDDLQLESDSTETM